MNEVKALQIQLGVCEQQLAQSMANVRLANVEIIRLQEELNEAKEQIKDLDARIVELATQE